MTRNRANQSPESTVENTNETPSKTKRIIAASAVIGVLAAVGAITASAHESSNGVPCDPVIDNGCTPDTNGNLPTLPPKSTPSTETTTTSTTMPHETTTTIPHETTTTSTTMPHETTTTTTIVSQPPELPPMTIVVAPPAPAHTE